MSITRSITRPITRLLTRPLTAQGVGGGWNPRSLFGGGEQGFIYDLSNAGSLFVDSARTTPVTMAGDLIGSVSDLSGNNNHASQAMADNKPSWQTAYASFDGTDDWLQTAAFSLAATDEITVIACVRKMTDAARAVVCEFSTSVGANDGSFNLEVPGSGNARFDSYSKGTTFATANVSGIAAPATSVLAIQANISAPLLRIRANGGAWGSTTATQGTGNYGSHAFYLGRRGGSSLPFSGYIYRLIAIGRLLTDQELSDAEAWAGQPAGIFF